MQEKKDEIRSHYNANPQKEWDRLKKKHAIGLISVPKSLRNPSPFGMG